MTGQTSDTLLDDHRIVFVTGPAGAGRSTAINVLEDLGFEAIDNLPMSLLPRLLAGPPLGRPLALGLDTRNRDFSVDGLLDLTRELANTPTVSADLLYIDCREDVLLRRYSETRRRHPMAPEDSPEIGVRRENELLTPIRLHASLLVDTSELSPHDLREELSRWYSSDSSVQMAVMVESFSYKRGVPRGVDMVFDCRFLRNPHWEPELREKTGREKAVQSYVEADPLCEGFFDGVSDLTQLLLPAFRKEGKSHLTIAFGCTGGRHRSVTMTEKLAKVLASKGWQVSKRHRELERHAKTTADSGKG